MKLTKTKTVTSLIYAIFLLFSVSANAQESEIKTEEYLWNPKMVWESKEIHEWYSGLRFINGESQIIYFADGYIYIRDAETGEILVKSKQYNYHPDSNNNDFNKSFHLSADKKELYAYLNNEYLIKLNQETLKPIDTLFIGQFSYLSLLRKNNNIQFIIPQIDKEIFIEKITDNEIIFNLQAVSIGNSPTNDYEFYGRVIISFDRTNDTFELKDTNRWKILHYIRNTYASNDHIHLNNYFVYADKLISFYKDPNRRIFLTDKRNFKQYNTGITIIRNNSFDSEYTFSSTKNQKYILVTHNFLGVSNDNIVDSLIGYIYDIENKTIIKTIDYEKCVKNIVEYSI